MDQAIGVVQVREAITSFGEPQFSVDDLMDELDVDEPKARKEIWKALHYMVKLDEVRKVEGSKPTRWKVIRLNTEGAKPKYESDALFGALLAWK